MKKKNVYVPRHRVLSLPAGKKRYGQIDPTDGLSWSCGSQRKKTCFVSKSWNLFPFFSYFTVHALLYFAKKEVKVPNFENDLLPLIYLTLRLKRRKN